jgi:hypothetical protein
VYKRQNIFCNSNWNIFINYLKSYEKGFYLIANGTKECDFPIKERYHIDKYLVNNWDTVGETETERILEFIKNKENELICFSAGPLSKIWIPKCMELNPNNIYLDIGSSLDYYTKDYTKETIQVRSYTYNKHYQSICSFT